MSSAHILVVESNANVRAEVVNALRMEGFAVSDASTVQQAADHALSHRPDIVLIEGHLPGGTGLDFGKRLVAEQNVPFVVLSAELDAKFVNEAIRAGAFGFFLKPLEISKVLPTLRAALVRGKELSNLSAGQGRLQNALDQQRVTSVAVGILMRGHGLNREEAFEALRQQARRQRRKLDEIAADIVLAIETLNNAMPRMEQKEHAESR
jgi:two-component system, response regulator PdtaR